MATLTTRTYAAGGGGPPQTLTAQIDDLVEKANERTRELVIRTIGKINAALIMNTPYRTGFLRASWHASINEMPPPPEPTAKQAKMAGPVGDLTAVAQGLKLGDIYYVTNGAYYAGYVEYGTARMAPRGFTRATLQLARQFAEQAAAEMGLT